MKLFDIFKKKKLFSVKTSESKKKKTEEKKELVKSPAVVKVKKQTKGDKIAHKILRFPHVTEKASSLAESGKYSFNIFPQANKTEVKRAIEELYGVDVVKINIINIHRRKRRVGKNFGFKKGYKKAIIELKKGQKIEIMPR